MSRQRTGRAATALLVLGAALSALPGFAGPAAASCPGPVLLLVPGPGPGPGPAVEAGGSIAVAGEGFVDECDDHRSCTAGCSGCRRPEVHPLREVTLQVRQDGRAWDLGTTDAEGRIGEIEWGVVLPSSLRPGRAVLRTGEGGRLAVRVSEPAAAR